MNRAVFQQNFVYEDRWRARFVPQAIVGWPLLTLGQSYLSKRQAEFYLLFYLKTSSASPSAPSSSQSPATWPLASFHTGNYTLAPAFTALSWLQFPGHVVLFVSDIPLHTCPLSPEGCLSSCHHASGDAGHLCSLNPGTILCWLLSFISSNMYLFSICL